ncbi:MAG: protein kinase, partial [Chloroflexota bacterium]
TPNWNFFLLTQVTRAKQDRTPPDAPFYNELSKIAERQSVPGRFVDATARFPQSSSDVDTGLRDDIANPPVVDSGVVSQAKLEIAAGRVHRGMEFRRRVGEQSGMGDVWLAYQPEPDREVAVKVIKPGLANDPDFIRRFEQEARVVARLEHPNIVPLYDYWREPDGAFLVMRYLRGGSLKDKFKEGAHAPGVILPWLEQIGAALAYAHQAGIIHRDIKPANILLDENNVAYVVDFGLARQISSRTETQSLGTPGYASPEQLGNEPVDGRADLFSLGIVIYELLTGQRGFGDSNWLQQLMNNPLPDIRDADDTLPAALNNIIQKVTEKAPADRYGTVEAFVTDFRNAIYPDATPTIIPQQHDLITLIDAPNPYRGLNAFQEEDGDNFFGREELTQRLVERLQERDETAHFLAVVGPSGSGKSSVVKAGLVPALRGGALPGSESWFVVEMLPGARPFEALEVGLVRVSADQNLDLFNVLRGTSGIGRAVKRVLPDDDRTELVLVIDQFEELFTITSEAIRREFMQGLLDAISDPRSRLWVVVTLRADFYDRPLSYPGFGDLIRQRTEVVLPMNDDELEAAIVRPAENAGFQFEPGLVKSIIDEVRDEPGSLPLLQYALTELYDRREGRALTHSAYEEMGGIEQALARRADEEYEHLGDADRDIVRRVFLRLVTPGKGVEDTRYRARRSELGSEEAVDRVLDAYSRARLLTTDRDPETREPTVEVAHEALIRSWERLRNWLNSYREDILVLERLRQSVKDWTEANEDSRLLAMELRLEQFEALRGSDAVDVVGDELRFLEASVARRDAEIEQKAREQQEKVEQAEAIIEANQRADTSTQRLRRTIVAAVIVGVGVAVIASVFAGNALQRMAQAADAVETASFSEGTAIR